MWSGKNPDRLISTEFRHAWRELQIKIADWKIPANVTPENARLLSFCSAEFTSALLERLDEVMADPQNNYKFHEIFETKYPPLPVLDSERLPGGMLKLKVLPSKVECKSLPELLKATAPEFYVKIPEKVMFIGPYDEFNENANQIPMKATSSPSNSQSGPSELQERDKPILLRFCVGRELMLALKTKFTAIKFVCVQLDRARSNDTDWRDVQATRKHKFVRKLYAFFHIVEPRTFQRGSEEPRAHKFWPNTLICPITLMAASIYQWDP